MDSNKQVHTIWLSCLDILVFYWAHLCARMINYPLCQNLENVSEDLVIKKLNFSIKLGK